MSWAVKLKPFRDTRGLPMVEAACDGCGETVAVRADIAPHKDPAGQVIPKITKHGLALIKRRLYCPTCNAARKADQPVKEDQMAAKTTTPTRDAAQEAPREPTREQKREIMAMLDVACDAGAGRYKGKDTDKTVANAMGGGILPGWVAAIREEFFGPDGGNDAMERLEADLRVFLNDAAAAANRVQREADAAIAAIRQETVAAQGYLGRLEAIRAAVGPKAGRL